jgi:excisionase family DNA binding protein
MKTRAATGQTPDILTLRQACKLLNCHPNTLRNWDNEGKLKAIRFGSRGDRRYKKADLLKLLQKN